MGNKIINWQINFDVQAEKYHRIGAWVAIALNMLWFIGDYFEIPAHWQQFFFLRLTVSVSILVTLLSYKKFNLRPHWLIFIPFLGIALQNSYMYSVMDAVQLQKHTFAYVALFIGAGMLILWKPVYSYLIVGLNLTSNLIFFPIFSPLNIEEILINGGMLTFSVTIFTILLIHTRYTLTKKEIISRLALEESKNEIEKQKEIIEYSHNEVKSSINYAERIQSALLAEDENWDKIGVENFILFKPRDIVSGDFYWAYHNDKKNYSIWAAADCTGHGVPGALMSMLGIGFLNEIVAENGEMNSGIILDKLRNKIIKSLKQKGEVQRKDGMDIALCVLDKNSNILQYSGAYNSLVLVRNKRNIIENNYKNVLEGEILNLYEYKADKMPIGKHIMDENNFSTTDIKIEKGDVLYTFSDGFADQFGGIKGKKYMIKKLKNHILSIQNLKMSEQADNLNFEFENWMKEGETKQIDDVCLIGVKI